MNREICRVGDVAEQVWRACSRRNQTAARPTYGNEKENREAGEYEQRRRQPSELSRNSQQPRADRDECEHEHGDDGQQSRSRYRQTDCENVDD